MPVHHLFSCEQLTLCHTIFKYRMNTFIKFVSEPDNSISDEIGFDAVIWMLFKTMEWINTRKLLTDGHVIKT